MKQLLAAVIIMLSIVTTITLLGSCKKYPNDNGIQLKSVKNRLIGTYTWDANPNMKWTFNHDNSCYTNYNGIVTTFKYELINHNNIMRVYSPSNSNYTDHPIEKLSDDILACELNSPTNITYHKQ